jgi:hypothetical protein
LRQKGVPDDAVQSALTGLDEEALAYEAAQKRVRRLESLEWNDFRTKLSEFLARRGFSYSVVAPVVSRTWNEMHAQHDVVATSGDTGTKKKQAPAADDRTSSHKNDNEETA